MKVEDLRQSVSSQEIPYLAKRQSTLPNIINSRNQSEKKRNLSKLTTYELNTGRKSILDQRNLKEIQKDVEIQYLNKANVMLMKIHQDKKTMKLHKEQLQKQKINQAQIAILKREVAKEKAREEMMKIKLEQQEQQDMIQSIFEPNKPTVVPSPIIKKAKFRQGQPGTQKRKVPLFKEIEIKFQQSLLKDEVLRQYQLKQHKEQKQVSNIRFSSKLLRTPKNENKSTISVDKFKKYLNEFDDIQTVPMSVGRIMESPQQINSGRQSLGKLKRDESERMLKKSYYSKIIDDVYERGGISPEKKRQIRSRLEKDMAQSQPDLLVKDQELRMPSIDRRQVLPSVQSVRFLEQPAYLARRQRQPQENRQQISLESLKLPQYVAYYDATYDETNANVRQQLIMLDSLIF